MKKDKVAYVLTYGLSEYFRDQLLKKIQMASFYALSIDECSNKIASKGQMDIIIRFWEEASDELNTRYLTSEKCDAGTIFKVLKDSLNSLGIKFSKITQLATDGPNVNIKLFELFRDYFSCDENPIKSKLCDVGNCTIHIVHNAYKTGHKKCG